ncbi:peptidase inhibitor family I36 protein [Streptomyces sp. NPDC001941]|uniref:peptidase inhibitor family I36 protein n=1 Tax=Streptomyces sp. NPDC001941 TaxID=3154659 RepID=UPI003322BAF6
MGNATFRSTAWGKALAALTMMLLVLVGSAVGDAHAAQGARAVQDGRAQRDFTAQARGAGLTAAQAKSLQARVDGYLAGRGGRQVAANKIDLGNAELLLALPGEQRARELTGGSAKLAAVACPYTYLCAYSKPNYTGDIFMLFDCGVKTPIPWSGTGSWFSNQRADLIARFYDGNGNVGYSAPGGSKDPNAPWGWVYNLSPC